MAPAKGKSTHASSKLSKWYKADDEKTRFVRKSKAPRPTKLRKSITPGTVLILLAGRYRGKRVVCLKQLKSGLLLVTGPFKINGVPLKRVNQAYVISTKTQVDVKGAKFEDINDEYFNKTVKKVKKSEAAFFSAKPQPTEAEETQKKDALKAKKVKQSTDIDKSIIESIKKTPLLAKYLAARFRLTNRTRPHELQF